MSVGRKRIFALAGGPYYVGGGEDGPRVRVTSVLVRTELWEAEELFGIDAHITVYVDVKGGSETGQMLDVERHTLPLPSGVTPEDIHARAVALVRANGLALWSKQLLPRCF
jgi:hypothetical protein